MWRYFNHKIVQWCWSSSEAECITAILNEYYKEKGLEFESVYQPPSSGGQTAHLVMIHEDLINKSHYDLHDIRKVMVNTITRKLWKASNEVAILKYKIEKHEAEEVSKIIQK